MEPVPIVAVIPNLGAGEREVISLAKSVPAALAILDDALARAYAKRLGVAFTGTLGVLLKAKQLGMIESLALLLNRLDEIGFRLDAGTRQAALKLAKELF
jgi:predicted nucleic acid-binding protein